MSTGSSTSRLVSSTPGLSPRSSPTGNTHYVHYDSSRLRDALVLGEPINLGQFIITQFQHYNRNLRTRFVFPCPITSLYRRSRILVNVSLQPHPIMKVWSIKNMINKFNTEFSDIKYEVEREERSQAKLARRKSRRLKRTHMKLNPMQRKSRTSHKRPSHHNIDIREPLTSISLVTTSRRIMLD